LVLFSRVCRNLNQHERAYDYKPRAASTSDAVARERNDEEAP